MIVEISKQTTEPNLAHLLSCYDENPSRPSSLSKIKASSGAMSCGAARKHYVKNLSATSHFYHHHLYNLKRRELKKLLLMSERIKKLNNSRLRFLKFNYRASGVSNGFSGHTSKSSEAESTPPQPRPLIKYVKGVEDKDDEHEEDTKCYYVFDERRVASYDLVKAERQDDSSNNLSDSVKSYHIFKKHAPKRIRKKLKDNPECYFDLILFSNKTKSEHSSSYSYESTTSRSSNNSDSRSTTTSNSSSSNTSSCDESTITNASKAHTRSSRNDEVGQIETVFDEEADEPSFEFARADDDCDSTNDQIRSYDEALAYYDVDYSSNTTAMPTDQTTTDQTSNKSTTDSSSDPNHSTEVEKCNEILDLVLHRLPGEKLGMLLKVESDGRVKVTSVVENGVAYRASDLKGNRSPIQISDEILEINGVKLKNMSNQDVISLVHELPLNVKLTLRRKQHRHSVKREPVVVDNNDSMDSGNQMPVGYILHKIFLTSEESKSIQANDVQECDDASGFYQIQKSTLQLGEDTDLLKKGDVLFYMNGEKLIHDNKNDLITKLGSLENGQAELAILRRSSYGVVNDLVPYHNGIFAQNSIKLAMRKYEKPEAVKSVSDIGVEVTGKSQDPPSLKEKEIVSEPIAPKENLNQSNVEPELENSMTKSVNIIDREDNLTENSSFNGLMFTSYHSDNWLFYDKRLHKQSKKADLEAEAGGDEDAVSKDAEDVEKCDVYSSSSFSYSNKNKVDEKNQPCGFRSQCSTASSLESSKYHKKLNGLESSLITIKTASFSNYQPSCIDLTKINGNILHKEEEEDTIDSSPAQYIDIYECPSLGSLTTSSCHSERSIVHLNCLVCMANDELSSCTVSGCSSSTISCQNAKACENRNYDLGDEKYSSSARIETDSLIQGDQFLVDLDEEKLPPPEENDVLGEKKSVDCNLTSGYESSKQVQVVFDRNSTELDAQPNNEYYIVSELISSMIDRIELNNLFRFEAVAKTVLQDILDQVEQATCVDKEANELQISRVSLDRTIKQDSMNTLAENDENKSEFQISSSSLSSSMSSICIFNNHSNIPSLTNTTITAVTNLDKEAGKLQVDKESISQQMQAFQQSSTFSPKSFMTNNPTFTSVSRDQFGATMATSTITRTPSPHQSTEMFMAQSHSGGSFDLARTPVNKFPQKSSYNSNDNHIDLEQKEKLDRVLNQLKFSTRARRVLFQDDQTDQNDNNVKNTKQDFYTISSCQFNSPPNKRFNLHQSLPTSKNSFPSKPSLNHIIGPFLPPLSAPISSIIKSDSINKSNKSINEDSITNYVDSAFEKQTKKGVHFQNLPPLPPSPDHKSVRPNKPQPFANWFQSKRSPPLSNMKSIKTDEEGDNETVLKSSVRDKILLFSNSDLSARNSRSQSHGGKLNRTLNKHLSPVPETSANLNCLVYKARSPVMVRKSASSPNTGAKFDSEPAPRRKLIINEEQAMINASHASRHFGQSNKLAVKKEVVPIIKPKLSVNFNLSKPPNHTESVAKTFKPISVDSQTGLKSIKEKEPSETVDNIKPDEPKDNEEPEMTNFKSVRERIEYFSGRLSRDKTSSIGDMRQSFLRKNPIYASQQNLATKPHQSLGSYQNNSLGRVVKTSQNVISTTSRSKSIDHKDPESQEDYDSLKFAYKLSSFNSTSNLVAESSSNSFESFASCNYKNDAKQELKSIFCQNENKISALIEHLEIRFKK